ncbi:MAG: hypothetical protein SFV17_16675 [Candidatus Obscuribacter sp.]|nr:hypothetical protein [Candidatus Obscuribacter sp.]
MNNQQTIYMFVILFACVPVGYFMTVFERTAWAKARPNLTFILFIAALFGLAFCAELIMKGGFLLPVVGMFLGGKIRSNQDRKRDAQEHKASVEAETSRLESDLKQQITLMLISNGQGTVTSIDVSKYGQEAVDAVIKGCIEQGLVVSTTRNHNTQAVTMTVSGPGSNKA